MKDKFHWSVMVNINYRGWIQDHWPWQYTMAVRLKIQVSRALSLHELFKPSMGLLLLWIFTYSFFLLYEHYMPTLHLYWTYYTQVKTNLKPSSWNSSLNLPCQQHGQSQVKAVLLFLRFKWKGLESLSTTLYLKLHVQFINMFCQLSLNPTISLSTSITATLVQAANFSPGMTTVASTSTQTSYSYSQYRVTGPAIN